MEDEASLNRATVASLLDPPSAPIFFRTEEQQHSWRTSLFQVFDKPFLRLWDRRSGSQPDRGRMRSRANRERLDTFDSRRKSLTIHINNRIWTPTPYVSFTTSPSKVEDLANWRVLPKRGPHTLTVVDPDVRIRNGLPVLHVSDEMEYYHIADPYRKSNEYYQDHYVCLWEVTDKEIVGHWDWEDLVRNENWYEEIVMPAFWRSRDVAQAATLSNFFTGLSSKFTLSNTMVTEPTKNSKLQMTPQTRLAVMSRTIPMRHTMIPSSTQILMMKWRKPMPTMIRSRCQRGIGERRSFTVLNNQVAVSSICA